MGMTAAMDAIGVSMSVEEEKQKQKEQILKRLNAKVRLNISTILLFLGIHVYGKIFAQRGPPWSNRVWCHIVEYKCLDQIMSSPSKTMLAFN